MILVLGLELNHLFSVLFNVLFELNFMKQHSLAITLVLNVM